MFGNNCPMLSSNSSQSSNETANPTATHFPFGTWLIAFTGWMFSFYDLVLFSFLLIPITHNLALTDRQQAVLLGTALGSSGIGGILFGYISDLYGRRRALIWTVPCIRSALQ